MFYILQTKLFRRRLVRLQKRIIRPAPHAFADGDVLRYLGHDYRLSITRNGERPQGCRLSPRRIMVNIHADDMSDHNFQQEVRLEILLWLKRRAKIKMQKRMDFWAQKMGLRYEKLVLSNPKSRWGSCSAKNIIRLNWRLIMTPQPLLDYVIVHELAHVTHKHHRKKFWDCVGSFMPDYQFRRAQLRGMERKLGM